MQNVVNGCVFFLKLIHDGKKVKENEKFDEATVWEEKNSIEKKWSDLVMPTLRLCGSFHT